MDPVLELEDRVPVLELEGRDPVLELEGRVLVLELSLSQYHISCYSGLVLPRMQGPCP